MELSRWASLLLAAWEGMGEAGLVPLTIPQLLWEPQLPPNLGE
jgi:hypothetical protein